MSAASHASSQSTLKAPHALRRSGAYYGRRGEIGSGPQDGLPATGTPQFTCFTGTKVQLLTQLLRQEFVDELVLTRTLKEELMSVFKEEAKIMADLDACEAELEAAGADMELMQAVLDKMSLLQKAADQKNVKTLRCSVCWLY